MSPVSRKAVSTDKTGNEGYGHIMSLSQCLTNSMYKICFTISFISCLYMFRAQMLIIRRSKLHYTASGSITPTGGCLVHRLREDRFNQPVHETATCRCDDTRGCVMQFWPPDDEHMCSKHVEAWCKTYCETKFCSSNWLNTEIFTEMQGQQNVKKNMSVLIFSRTLKHFSF